MELGLKGRRALVTAAGRGIGRAIALSLAREGVVVAVVARTECDIRSLVEEMNQCGSGHYGLACDLCEEKGPAQLVAALAANQFESLDIVVHNLGGALDVRDPFCPIEDWRHIYRLNFEVAVELNGLLLPAMRARGWGRVVHISSIAGMENQGPVPYCAAKAALTAYTRSMGGVVAPDGVVLSAVLPGAVYTEGGYWDEASKTNPEHVRKFLTERQRIGRFGTTTEIASLVTFLCSGLASFNTGAIIPIDGGQGRGYFGQ